LPLQRLELKKFGLLPDLADYAKHFKDLNLSLVYSQIWLNIPKDDHHFKDLNLKFSL
jgi:hypothetical protein